MEKEIGYYWLKINDKWKISFWNGVKFINPYRSSINLSVEINIQEYYIIKEPIINTNEINGLEHFNLLVTFKYWKIDNIITKVLRLENQQSFEIGDQIRTYGLSGTISGFTLINDNIQISFLARNYPIQTVLLQNARKL